MTMILRTSPMRRVQWGVGESRQLLSASDFTYLGSYTVDNAAAFDAGGGALGSGRGLTLRWRAGQLRFITFGKLGYDFKIVELTRPANYGDTISTSSGVWGTAGTTYDTIGLFWDETNGGLWTTDAADYPETTEAETTTKTMVFRVLESDGSVSGVRGRFGLQGVNSRKICTGMCRIPTWYQSAHGVPEFAIGFGGSYSRASIGPVSFGPTMYAIPDPRSGADNSEISSGSIKTMMDHSYTNGVSLSEDWYDDGVPTTFDRGIRFNSDLNPGYDFDVATGTIPQWTNPAPDGYTRWTWSDKSDDTSCWVDNDAGTRTKHGFVLVPRLMTGDNYYANSTTNHEGSVCELQIFNPSHLAESAAGTRHPCLVQPISGKSLTETAEGAGDGGTTQRSAAAFDPVENKLYVYMYGTAIHVYSVGGV